MPQIEIENHDNTIEYNSAALLLNNFRMQGVPIGSQCGGRGNCGTCRIKILEGHKKITPINKTERFKLTEEELNEGWRLSCQCYAVGKLKIFVPPVEKQQIL